MTDKEMLAEIDKLRERIETLELDVSLLKAIRIQESFPQPYVPYQPWVSPSSPAPYWQFPTVICEA